MKLIFSYSWKHMELSSTVFLSTRWLDGRSLHNTLDIFHTMSELLQLIFELELPLLWYWPHLQALFARSSSFLKPSAYTSLCLVYFQISWPYWSRSGFFYTDGYLLSIMHERSALNQFISNHDCKIFERLFRQSV